MLAFIATFSLSINVIFSRQTSFKQMLIEELNGVGFDKTVILIALIFMFVKTWNIFVRSSRWITHLLAFVFSCFMLIGLSYSKLGNWDFIFGNKRQFVIAFLILNILRTGIQVNNFSLDFSDKHILYWYTSIGILCAVCVIAFCFSFDINSIGIRNIIARISSCTFLIYLLHPLVKNTLSRFDIQNQISAAVVRGSFISECLYTIIMILLLFMISLFIAAILKLIKYLWLRIVHYKDAKVASQKY